MSKSLSASRLANLLHKIYPRQLAGSWDNTGLLLESPFTRNSQSCDGIASILLCIDLTTQVCDEALNTENCSHIVAYHPIIFSGLKSLTLANTQQRSLLRLAAAGISVYCPHTAIDAIHGGVNEMLVDCFKKASQVTHSQCVEPCKTVPAGFEGAGVGRKITLSEEITIEEAVKAVKQGLGLVHIQLGRALPREKTIKTIGLCAGSGGSVLKDLDVDLIFTGELSHHEQLAFVEKGVHIILCGHTNTERPFLPTMRGQIQSLLDSEGERAHVVISEKDSSPFETV